MQRKLPRRKDIAQNDSAMNYFFDNFVDQKRAPKERSHDPKRKPMVLVAIWAALSLTGVAAAVAITVTGNSGSSGQVSGKITGSANSKKITITCVKGSSVKKVTDIKPICPTGYTKK